MLSFGMLEGTTALRAPSLSSPSLLILQERFPLPSEARPTFGFNLIYIPFPSSIIESLL